MRISVAFALGALLIASPFARAEDEGFLGVQIEIRDGKLVVKEPLEGGPADKAGIKADDVIVKIGDYKIKDNVDEDELKAAVKEVSKRKAGDKVKVEIKRGDKDMTIEVTLGKRPKEKE
jgi:C-terminal processing protease CtpA/Prc